MFIVLIECFIVLFITNCILSLVTSHAQEGHWDIQNVDLFIYALIVAIIKVSGAYIFTFVSMVSNYGSFTNYHLR